LRQWPINLGQAVFSQLIEHLPHQEFQKCAARYCGSSYVKNFSCWDQSLAMAFAQLTYRESLRDIEACLREYLSYTRTERILDSWTGEGNAGAENSLRDPCSCSRLRSSRKVCITAMIAPSGRSSSVHPHTYACMGTVCAPCQMPGAKAGRQSTHARSDGWSTADSSFVRGRSRFMTCSSDVILARHNIATALRRCVGHQGTQIGELSKASNASDSFSSMKPG
jgi:Domain of unknown function (DUF4372)